MFARNIGLARADETQYDPHWGSTVLLLGFENNLTDDSTKAHSLTVTGAITYSTTTVKYDTYSGFINSGSNYLNVATTSNFFFGTGDFTVETWLNVPGTRWASGNVCVMDTSQQNNGVNGGPNFFGLSTSNANVTAFRTAIYNNSAWGFVTNNTVLGLNTWHHCVWGRGNGKMYFGQNGVIQMATGTDTKNYFPYGVKIKQDFFNEYGYQVYFDEFRVTNGRWRYGAIAGTTAGSTATYTVPTTRFPRQ